MMSETVPENDVNSILRSRVIGNYDGYRRFISEHESTGAFARRQELFVTGPPISDPNPEIVSWIKKAAVGTKVLDVGCGAGAYSRVIQSEGFECIGIDINVDVLRSASNAGVQSLLVDAMKIAFRDKAFDMILLIEVLEHVVNPGGLLTEAGRLAKKRIFITVPNLEPLPYLAQFNVVMHHFLEPSHHCFFTKKMLEELLSKYFGRFEVERFGRFFPFLKSPQLYYHLRTVVDLE